MKMMTRTMTTLTLLLILTACDYSKREEAKTERAEQQYQEAIARYKTGDLEAAVAGFKAAVKDNPSNASARFQLAVLLQESAKDYLGAMSSFWDYELLAPTSDKARMAHDRAEKCERLLARQLAEKYGFGKVEDLQKELDETTTALANAQAEIVGLRDEAQALRREVDRLKSARGMTATRPSAAVSRPPVSAPVAARPVPSPAAAPTEPVTRTVPLVQTRPTDESSDSEKNLREVQALLADARDDTSAEEAAGRKAATPPSVVAPVVFVPAPAPVASAAPQPRLYRVKPGDGFYSIARANYPGLLEHKAVELIRKANPSKANGVLKPGDELLLP